MPPHRDVILPAAALSDRRSQLLSRGAARISSLHRSASLRRRAAAPPASPAPVTSPPDPAVVMPDPSSGHPYRVDIRGHDIRAGHPDVLDAVPAPIARLPDITGSRRRRHHLYDRSGWGK